jgi:peptidyl-dipeptidase A
MDTVMTHRARIRMAAAPLAALLFALVFTHCSSKQSKDMTQELTDFIARHESAVKPLAREAAIAYFDATISGSDEAYKKAADLELALSKIYADTTAFATLKEIRASGSIAEPMLARQLEVLYHEYLAKQIAPDKLEAMIRLSNATEKKFATFRAEVGGRKLTDNEIEDVLKTSKNSAELEAAWTASKKVGALVSEDVLALVRMRNESARKLGFANYHAMQLELSEQDPAAIEKLFDELDVLTRDAFAGLKGEIDAYLSKRLGVPADKLMPWHYQNRYFQEAPKLYAADLDGLYKDKDLVAITTTYFEGIGLPIEDLVAKSDLFEKEGKYQHAYCTDIDREGDVRVVCNVKPNYNWMNTMLHEYGHAVYDKFNDRAVPYVLREPAHTFTTEAIAMIFGRFAAHPVWMKDVAGVPAEKVDAVAADARRSLRLEQLTFSRWVQVMYRFEKAMYENPDQDLNTLWWDLVEKYQMIRRPEGRNAPDWASKIHVALYPAYYHNYLMGELLASQLYYHIGGAVLKTDDVMAQSFAGRTDVGEYLRTKVFAPGATMHWNDMIEKATGEKLTAKYYARQFVEAGS